MLVAGRAIAPARAPRSLPGQPILGLHPGQNVTLRQSGGHRGSKEFRRAAGASSNEGSATSSEGNVASSSSSSSPPSPVLPQGPSEPSVPYWFVASLGAAGFLETAYLTVVKLTHVEVACPTAGCEAVLSSSYAELFGVPLPLLGAATYGGVALLAAFAGREQREGRHVARLVDGGLVAGVVALATCSSVLMYILHTRLGDAPCTWCYASAGLSFTLALSLILSLDRRSLVDAAAPGMGVLAGTLLVLSLGLSSADKSTAQADYDLPYVAPVVTTDSSNQAVALARRLKEAGAKMYGAFWCTHCFDQKQAFGKDAMEDFPYVECYPEGFRRGVKIADACSEANIRAFPTWIINGHNREGELALEDLEQELDLPPGQAEPTVAAAELQP